MLAARGLRVFDCDRIYHEMISHPGECTSELAAHFGPTIVDGTTGGIDRSALADTVFGDADALSALNSITHKYVTEAINDLCRRATEDGCHSVIDAPLLFEAGCDSICDMTVAILASRRDRLARLIGRDGRTRTTTQLLSRLNSSQRDTFYTARCTYTFRNNGSTEDLEAFADKIAAEANKEPPKVGDTQ